MWRTAQSPRNGMEPCAMRPWVSISRPPHAAMADADPVHVQGLGNDDVIDARRREAAALGEIMNAAVAAGFLVHRARDLERARKRRARVDQRLHGDDGGREPALHVARAAAEELAVAHHAGEGLDGPAGAGLHHVDMAVEVHARSRRSALAARDHIDARPALRCRRASPRRARTQRRSRAARAVGR